jgi:hypothetical protein
LSLLDFSSSSSLDTRDVCRVCAELRLTSFLFLTERAADDDGVPDLLLFLVDTSALDEVTTRRLFTGGLTLREDEAEARSPLTGLFSLLLFRLLRFPVTRRSSPGDGRGLGGDAKIDSLGFFAGEGGTDEVSSRPSFSSCCLLCKYALSKFFQPVHPAFAL